jgi:hypothetical protein
MYDHNWRSAVDPLHEGMRFVVVHHIEVVITVVSLAT